MRPATVHTPHSLVSTYVVYLNPWKSKKTRASAVARTPDLWVHRPFGKTTRLGEPGEGCQNFCCSSATTSMVLLLVGPAASMVEYTVRALPVITDLNLLRSLITQQHAKVQLQAVLQVSLIMPDRHGSKERAVSLVHVPHLQGHQRYGHQAAPVWCVSLFGNVSAQCSGAPFHGTQVSTIQ